VAVREGSPSLEKDDITAMFKKKKKEKPGNYRLVSPWEVQSKLS